MGAQAVRLSNIDIDNALKNKDFEVLFQPIFDLANGALARVETFVRWRHPSLGVLPPGAFISFFETQGRMSELTRYVLAEALREYQEWRGPFPPGFSINLALSDLTDEGFASHLTVVLRETGFPPECVTLECPMPPTPVDLALASKQFQRLADTGARLAIEVRGRANDFLRSIDPFPFAEIKTGGAAILRFARTVRGPGLSAISELLEMANAQNAAITAVGVEDQASLSALRGLGFAAAQGNHLGKVGALNQFTPSRVNEVRTLLELEPLSKDDLAALFRTGGPSLSKAPAASKSKTKAGAPKDDLVERLAARIERVDEPDSAPAQESESDENKEKALKAAAIARARAKLAQRAKRKTNPAADAAEEETPPISPPRDMQHRLSQEFEAYADEMSNEEAPRAHSRPLAEAKPNPPGTDTPAIDEFELSDDADAAPLETASPEAPPESLDESIHSHDDGTEIDDFEEQTSSATAEFVDAKLVDEADEDGGVAVAPEDHFETSHKRPADAVARCAVGEAHVSIHDASAHFVPGIRVMSPAPAPHPVQQKTPPQKPQQSEFEITPDVEADNAVDVDEAKAFGRRAGKPAAAARPTLSQAETTEPEIAKGSLNLEDDDEPAAQLQETVWIEESVAIEDASRQGAPRRKNFLNRTIIPYAALRPKHFWPRPVRKWMKKRAAAKNSDASANSQPAE